jgi:hypothetical protein
MRIVLLAAVLAVLARPADAQIRTSHLSTRDWSLLALTSALIIVDWGQTLEGQRRGHTEANPVFLTPRPSPLQLNLMIGAGLLANLAVSQLKAGSNRTLLWSVILVVESIAVISNSRHVGIRMPIRF